jgi:protein-tyrosine phosphatase
MTKILMVCLGNICRSPLAEGILRDKVNKAGLHLVHVDSAGTAPYHIGENPDKRSILNAHKHGIDISGHVGRQLNRDDFYTYDRIYVMDESNYVNAIELAGDAPEKGKVKLILDELNPGSGQSVPDPYYGGEDGFEEVFQLLDKACQVILLDLNKTNKH